jgi:hypothetical protein
MRARGRTFAEDLQYLMRESGVEDSMSLAEFLDVLERAPELQHALMPEEDHHGTEEEAF